MAGATAALYLYFFHRQDLEQLLGDATAASNIAGGTVYFVFGCLRGFTLIPVTSLVLLGVVFFPSVPLFVLTLAGILVSSASVYYFAEALHVDELLRKKHCDRLDRGKCSLSDTAWPSSSAGASFRSCRPISSAISVASCASG